MHSDTMIGVVVVVQNDVAIVADFVKELTAVLQPEYAFYEILFIDLGSTDGTNTNTAGFDANLSQSAHDAVGERA